MRANRSAKSVLLVLLFISLCFGTLLNLLHYPPGHGPKAEILGPLDPIQGDLKLHTQIQTTEGVIYGSGLPANVTLLCNNSGFESHVLGNSQLDITSPYPWAISYTNFTFTDIFERFPYLTIEDSLTSTAVDTDDEYYAMAFNVSEAQVLNNLSVRIKRTLKLTTLDIKVYNATFQGADPIPDTELYLEQFSGISDHPEARWHNFTFSSVIPLDPNQTHNNTFFIELHTTCGPGGAFEWGYELDSTGLDYGPAYQYVTGWSLEPWDFNLKVGLGDFRTPSEIDLRVNGTAVSNTTGYCGEWLSNSSYSDFDDVITYHFSASAPVSFDLDWFVSYRLTADFGVNTYFSANSSDPVVHWNATYAASFLPGSFDKRIDFELPLWNSVMMVMRGMTEHTNWNQFSAGASRIISVFDAENASWFVRCNDSNYIETVFAERAGIPVSIVNSTDTVDIFCNFTEFLTTGDANLTIFPQDANYNDTLGESITNNKTIRFDPAWEILNTALGSFSEVTLQVSWFNGTAAGIKTHLLTVAPAPTNLTILSHTPTVVSGGSIFIYANLTVLKTQESLSGASLNVKNSIDGSDWPTPYQINQYYPNGTYKIEVLTVGLTGGVYSLSVNMSKLLYLSSEVKFINVSIGGAVSNISVTHPNCFGLQKINASYALAAPIPYHNSTIRIGIYYYANFTLEPLRNGLIATSWVGGGPPTTWVPAYFGYYNITLDVTGFHAEMNHTIEITIQESGYDAAVLYVIVPIKKLPTSIESLEPNYSAYLEETISVYAIYRDEFNEISIPSVYELDGNCTIQIESFEKNMSQLISYLGIYFYSFSPLSLGLQEGAFYNITFRAISSEHELATTNISLYITPKSEVNLTILSLPDSCLAGCQFKAYALLTTSNGTIIPNTPVNYQFIYQPASLIDAGTGITNSSGIMELFGEAPASMESFQLALEFEGSPTLRNVSITSQIVPIIKLASNIIFNPLPDEILIGKNIEISANLTVNGSPVAEQIISFTITYLGSTNIDTKSAGTDENGVATISLKIPSGVTRISISASYDGAVYVNGSNTASSLRVISVFTLIGRYSPLWGTIVAVVVAAYSVYTYRYRKPKQRRKLKGLQELAARFEDLKSTIYLLFIEKEKGVPIFEYSVRPTEINPVLIGGFINAISSFKDQILKPKEKLLAERWVLDYENFKILRFDGITTFLAILSEKIYSDLTHVLVNNLLMNFENRFTKKLSAFKGKLSDFNSTDELIKTHLEIELVFDQTVNYEKLTGETALSKTQSALLALAMSMEKESGCFSIDKLVKTASSARGESDLALLGEIYNLWKQGFFISEKSTGTAS